MAEQFSWMKTNDVVKLKMVETKQPHCSFSIEAMSSNWADSKAQMILPPNKCDKDLPPWDLSTFEKHGCLGMWVAPTCENSEVSKISCIKLHCWIVTCDLRKLCEWQWVAWVACVVLSCMSYFQLLWYRHGDLAMWQLWQSDSDSGVGLSEKEKSGMAYGNIKSYCWSLEVATSAAASHQVWYSNPASASFWNSNLEFWTGFSSTISSHRFYFVLFRFLFSLFLLFNISWCRLSRPWNKTGLISSTNNIGGSGWFFFCFPVWKKVFRHIPSINLLDTVPHTNMI